MTRIRAIIILLLCQISVPSAAKAADPEDGDSSSSCSEMEFFDVAMGMCMPVPMAGMPMRMLMLHGNAFVVGTEETGPRGRSAVTAPDMLMADLGTSLGGSNYLNLDYMGTVEKWAFPSAGYPELLQIGETNAQGQPFVDAQHPHSSPVMGLTLSDTISLHQGTSNLKLFFAPRGESTDGPVAFMHRTTGETNPDAPLGHHIGQDVGHVTSTVLGASLKMGDTHFEASAFHGAEPDPTEVDLPIGTLDSYAFRAIEELSPGLTAMASFAYVNHPEPDQPGVRFEDRYSASLYLTQPIFGAWKFHDTLIFGLVTNYDGASTLASVGEEFLFQGGPPRIWGRLEAVQRTPAELEIATTGSPNQPSWVMAVTLGYTQQLATIEGINLGLGGSATLDFLPGAFSDAYGGNPWTGKVFLQMGGMGMWNL